MSQHRTRWLKGVALAVVVVATVGLWASGTAQEMDAEVIRTWLLAAGIWGGLLYIVAVAVIQPLHVSIYIWLVGASLVWDPPTAMLLGWLGCMGAALTSFVFGRWVGQEWFDDKLPKRFRRYNERLETHTFQTVLILRLIFFTTPVVQYAYGASKVRFWPWLAAMGLGAVPYVVGTVWVGESITAWLFSS